MAEQPALELRNCSKSFGQREVLHSANLTLKAGEVHGLVGQNGSGKSTLIKILAGFHEPSPGAELKIRGEPVPFPLHAKSASAHGVSFVHQDLGLFDDASVLENVAVGTFQVRPGYRISWRAERRRIEAALADFGVHVSVDDPAGSLSPADKASVAIVRALLQLGGGDRGGVLVLDEPTPHLTRDGIDRLFVTVRRAVARGVAVLFVTHRLDEIIELTTTVTVLRDGSVFDSRATSDLDQDSLSELLLGFRLPPGSFAHHDDASPDGVLGLRHVTAHQLRDVSFTVGRQEILGLTGPVGAGWETAAQVAAGAIAATAGEIVVEDERINVRKVTPLAMIQRGVAYVPGDRARFGAVITASVEDNLTLPALRQFYRKGLLRQRLIRASSAALLREFDVRPPDPQAQFGSLSGGNQQKVVLAKWLSMNPRATVLIEPTQGVDVGARHEIYARLKLNADRGGSVIVGSTEYEDLARLCDRVLVFHDGVISTELRGDSLTPSRLLERVFGRPIAEIAEERERDEDVT